MDYTVSKYCLVKTTITTSMMHYFDEVDQVEGIVGRYRTWVTPLPGLDTFKEHLLLSNNEAIQLRLLNLKLFRVEQI